jgi:DNA-binding transcriptional MerR regulator
MLDDRDRTFTIEEIEQQTGFDRRTIAYYVQEGLLPKVGRRGPRTRYPRPYLDRLLFIKKIRDLQDQGQLGNYTLDDIREIFDTVPERMIADIVSGKEPLEVAPYGRTLRGRSPSLASPRERIERLRRLSESQRPADADMGPTRPLHRRSSWLADAPPAERHSDHQPAAAGGLESLGRVEESLGPRGPDPRSKAPRPPLPDDEDEAALFLDLDSPQGELMVRRVVEDVASAADSIAMPERRATPPPSTLARMLAQLNEAAGRRTRGGGAERWTRAEVTPDVVLSVRGLDEDSAQLLERVARLLRAMIGAGRTGRG